MAPWIDNRVFPDQRSRAQDAVATDFSVVPDNRPEFPQACRETPIRPRYDDIRFVELHIGKDHPGPQMRFESQDRIANIVVVRDLRPVENQGILKLAGGTTRNADTWNLRLVKADGRIMDSWVTGRLIEPGDEQIVLVDGILLLVQEVLIGELQRVLVEALLVRA